MDRILPGPVHDLQVARRLVASGSYHYADGKSCMRALLLELETMVEAIEFIGVAFELLTPGDYCGTVLIDTQGIHGTYDEYAFRVPPEVYERFKLRAWTWYAKFKLVTVRGHSVFLLSLHRLTKPERRRRDGLLNPG